MKRPTVTIVALACALVAWEAFASRTEAIRAKPFSQDRRCVFVAMHRGDWRSFPENPEGAILDGQGHAAELVVHLTQKGRRTF